MTSLMAKAALHAPVITGLIVGSAAKFGRMLAINEPFTKKHVIGHIMMMGTIGVVATYLVDVLDITDPNKRTFVAAILAIAGTDVLEYLRTRAWKRFFVDAEEIKIQDK